MTITVKNGAHKMFYAHKMPHRLRCGRLCHIVFDNHIHRNQHITHSLTKICNTAVGILLEILNNITYRF